MPADASDMAIVHRVFRNELLSAPGLVRGVHAGDITRSALVGAHINLMTAALHHHHVAEDELVWPKLHVRAPSYAEDIARMETAHRGIARADEEVRILLDSWMPSANGRLGEELANAVEHLAKLVDEHLTDEESVVVPLINAHLEHHEWLETVSRASEFLSRKNLRLGLVVSGYLLDNASASERGIVLANVPLFQRTVVRIFAKRVTATYRYKLHTAST